MTAPVAFRPVWSFTDGHTLACAWCPWSAGDAIIIPMAAGHVPERKGAALDSLRVEFRLGARPELAVVRPIGRLR